MGIFIKNETQIGKMRIASRIVAETHQLLERSIRPGITTRELNILADDYIRSCGAVPSFLGYKMTGEGFPAAICVSVNEEIIHGIPSRRQLKSGDIVSIDIGAYIERFHGDAARTHAVGNVLPERQQLIDVTKQSFFEAIKYARAGKHLHEISFAIEDYVERYGFSIIREFCGHGVGRKMHEDPQIPHYKQQSRGPRLQRGMTLAIEPMVVMGTPDIRILDDNWTVVTKDRSCAAHYENTVLITDGEPDLLTLL
ncbi:MAG: type I methionyl aminopeptidase [Turicibacter sp.]|nr:type I methionyl aminopeptidase [Turicibacter sp.]